MTEVRRFWPLRAGQLVTSPFGPRPGGFHAGCDFGFPGGSAGEPVYAIQSGTVLYAGAAQGYGGDPAGLAGWLVIDSNDAQGGGVLEYGHIVRLPDIGVGTKVTAGQQIAIINPNTATNGGTLREPIAPHLHLSDMPREYDPDAKQDPLPRLRGALEPPAIKEKTVGWTGDPTWLADVLKAYRPALKVRELPDWQDYGHGDYGDIWGVMVHHTGNAAADAMSIRVGRPDLEGPVSNLHIAQDGTVTVVAGGVCWHAGNGSYPGLPTDGANFRLIGIECAWPRDLSITEATETRERWPDAEIIAMRDTVAAILNRLGYGASRVIAHKEWAHAAQGKWDPGNLNMDWFRGEVAKALRGDFKTIGPKLDPVVPTKPPAPPAPPAPSPAAITQSQWDSVARSSIEWLAIEFGDHDAIEQLAQLAGNGDARALRAIDKLVTVNPTAAQQFRDAKKGAA